MFARSNDSRLSHSPSFGEWWHISIAHKLCYALKIILFLVSIVHRDCLNLLDLYEREGGAASPSVFNLCGCAARSIPEPVSDSSLDDRDSNALALRCTASAREFFILRAQGVSVS